MAAFDLYFLDGRHIHALQMWAAQRKNRDGAGPQGRDSMRQLRRQDQPVDVDQQDFDCGDRRKLRPNRWGVDEGPGVSLTRLGLGSASLEKGAGAKFKQI
jgi:hypothetical protein